MTADTPITAEREAFERLLEHVDTWPGTIDYHGLPKWIKRLDELRVEARAALSAPPPADPLLGQALQALVRYANACDADAKTVAVIQELEARIDAAPPAASGVAKKLRVLTMSELAEVMPTPDKHDAIHALNILRKFAAIHGFVLTDWDGNELASIGQVLTQPSGVDALWVERAMELAEELETAAILYGASEPESDEERDCRRRRLATREALRAHLSTALTGAAKGTK